MSGDINCPLCNNPVASQSRLCNWCGVDLAVVTALLEPSLTRDIHLPKKLVTPQALVPRIGDSLIEKGLINPDDLQRALEYQRQKIQTNEPYLIGQALVDLGYIDQSTLDEVVIEQIFLLHKALRETNDQLERRVEQRTIELQNALIKLTELNQLKSNFISNVSHELRTPLTHIKGYLELFAEQSLGPLTPQQIEALDVLQRAEYRLETLINNLIQFTMASKGELSIDVHPAALSEIVDPVLNQVNPKAETKQIYLEVSLPMISEKLMVDIEKITWSLSQLFDNAIKFTPDGGKVKFFGRMEKELVEFSIEDNGIGISSERLTEIFEPFHQLDGSMTRHYSGTGLGLALVQRILEMHGSQLSVKSTPGVGSCFSFSLPLVT